MNAHPRTVNTADWFRVVPMIEKAIPALKGTHGLKDVTDSLVTGKLALWAGQECFILTEIFVYPKMRELNVFLVGGDLDEIRSYDDRLTAFAKVNGCSRITSTARTGFKRNDIWKQHGWKMDSVILTKDICDG
jgi:hypothetical protein